MATQPKQTVAYSDLDIPRLAALICAEREREYPSPTPFQALQRKRGIISGLKTRKTGSTEWAKRMHAANVAKHRYHRAEMQAKSTPTMQGPRADKYRAMAEKKAKHE